MYKLLYKNLKDEIVTVAESKQDIIYYDKEQAWLIVDTAWIVDIDKVFTVTFVSPN
jgi:hypothetical protein